MSKMIAVEDVMKILDACYVVKTDPVYGELVSKGFIKKCVEVSRVPPPSIYASIGNREDIIVGDDYGSNSV